MGMRGLLLLMAVCTVCSVRAAEWRNLDEEHHLGGRMASSGYLLGKVVLVDRWGAKCPPCRELLPQVEEIWRSFKGRQFVVLGGHCAGWGGAEQVKALIREKNLTFPVYEDAGLKFGEPEFDAIPFLYVVDATGRIVYRGREERTAREVIVNALTDLENPRDLAQWKRFLAFELENLPGLAYLRLTEFKKKFPAEAKEYASQFKALSARQEVKQLAALVEFSRKARDTQKIGPKDNAKRQKLKSLIEGVISKSKRLKDSSDPKVAQEAKNALADLKWKLAAIK